MITGVLLTPVCLMPSLATGIATETKGLTLSQDVKEDSMHMRLTIGQFFGSLVLALIMLSGAPFVALAKEAQTSAAGKKACDEWCAKNNKTDASRSKCYVQCDIYWSCNGSDSTAHTCQFVKSAYANMLTVAPKKSPIVPPPSNASPKAAR